MEKRIYVALIGLLGLGVVVRVLKHPDLPIEILNIPVEFFLCGIALIGVTHIIVKRFT